MARTMCEKLVLNIEEIKIILRTETLMVFFFFFLYTLLGHFLFKDPNLDQYLPDFSVLRHHLDGLEM